MNHVQTQSPLLVLSGADDEWTQISKGFWQNKRCGRVFLKEDEGGQRIAYDIEGKVFLDSDGCAYTSPESCVVITFPYAPRTEYVKAPL